MDATEKHVVAIAKAASEMGEPTVLTEIGGLVVTVHVSPFETAVDHARWGQIEVLREWPKGLHSSN